LENNNLQKPCLIKTAQGFSVSYKGKFLYSKYNPSKVILQSIEKLTIQPGTLFLCCSPLLPYGILELIAKLPEDCFLLLCEKNQDLYDFSLSLLSEEKEIRESWKNIQASQKAAYLTQNELYALPEILNKQSYTFKDKSRLPKAGSFRRIIQIDFSAAAALNEDFYKNLQEASTKALMTFWSNRVTLVKFGRNYSHNFFKNLNNLPKTKAIKTYFQSVKKPIIVFGAGESINKGIEEIKNEAKNYFILCTDTSLTSLLKNNIIPDGVFVEEAQQIIIEAFIGTKAAKTHIFASLSSTPLISANFDFNRISFFTTLYNDCTFISDLQKKALLPPANPPFGSVGLTSVYYAIQFRKDESVPVYIYGLDFSYSAGLTHAKGTLAHLKRLKTTNRLNPLQNYRASFNNNAHAVLDKENKLFYTTHILQSYANTFNAYFYGSKNLYDSGACGIKLDLIRKSPSIKQSLKVEASKNPEIEINEASVPQKELTKKIKTFLQNEIEKLEELKSILSGEKKLSKEEADSKIKEIAQPREYLYLHFPDGWNFSLQLSFLKRIRIELDYYLKIFKQYSLDE